MSGFPSATERPSRTGSAHDAAEPSLLRRILPRFRPFRRMLYASLLLVLGSVGLNAIGPLLLKEVLNRALPQHDVPLLSELCAALVISAAMAGLIGVWQGSLANHIGQGVVHGLRIGLYDSIQARELTYFSRDANTEIQARLVSDIGGVSAVLTFTAQGALNALVSLATAVVVMLVLSWPLGLASIVLALAVSLLNRRFNARRDRLATQTQTGTADMMKLVAEDLSLPGVILGRTLGRTAAQRARFVAISQRVGDLAYQERMAGRRALATVTATMACFLPATYWLAGTLAPGISLGTVVVVATMQTRLTGPIQYLLGLGGTVQASRAMFRRIFEYIDDAHPAGAPTSAGDPGPDVPDLTVHDVGFSYPDSDGAGLHGVSASFPARSLTLITGASGAGKSTLAWVMSGLLTPSAGELLLDGRVVTPAELRRVVALIPQEPIIFNASLRENLLFARPDATDGDLREVLTSTQLNALVSRLPDGLDTAVGERGFQLSGGERQRLAIARTLLADHRILVVDEATSALDTATADEIGRWLAAWAAHRTVIVISHHDHRWGTDPRRVVIADGTAVEPRPPEQTGSYRPFIDAGFPTRQPEGRSW
jgi:ATP-binding cassette, subfamily B, bacterial